MAKYIDAERLRAEIDRIEEEARKVRVSGTDKEAIGADGKVSLCLKLKSLIDSLQQEQSEWKEVDSLNYPLPNKDSLYCVFTKEHYLLAKVIEHPNDEELLQWRCTEFPFTRYDMCDGDKYIKIK